MPKPQKIKDAAPAYSMKRGVWALDDIKEYPGNARTHPPEQIDLLGKLIEKYGQDQDIVVDEDGVILKGHGRKTAMKAIGWKEAEVTQRFGLSDADKRAMRINDNVVALLSGWDQSLLAFEAKTLQSQGFNMQLLGFARSELLQLTDSNPGATDPEAVPEPPKVLVSKFGDVWTLGRHRLCCGDSTAAADVERLLAGEKPNLMVTDAPYGVEYDANWRNEADRANGKPYGARAIGKVQNDGKVDWREAWKLFPGDVVYSWHAGRHASAAQSSLESCGFEIVCQVIWAKTRLIISRGDYHWQHEPCWYAVRKGKKHHWNGDRSQTTLWTINHQKSETGHSTQKPIECMKRPIENNSKAGDSVYDPFGGSFTTLIACEMTGRVCYSMEIDPIYCDVGILRWEKFTGQKATLDGKTYDEVKKERERAKGDRGKSVRRKGTVATERDQTPAQHPVREEVRQGRGDARRGANRKPPAADATGNPPGS